MGLCVRLINLIAELDDEFTKMTKFGTNDPSPCGNVSLEIKQLDRERAGVRVEPRAFQQSLCDFRAVL